MAVVDLDTSKKHMQRHFGYVVSSLAQSMHTQCMQQLGLKAVVDLDPQHEADGVPLQVGGAMLG
jgi:hypothetical protein